MAAVTLPPRQKMINMMYLVLTAILALNVSKEVLDAFAVLDADLVRSERAHEQRSQLEYAAFEEAARKFPERYTAALDQARVVHAAADSLVSHITAMKARAIARAEGRPLAQVVGRDADGRDSLLALTYIEAKDDRDALTHLLIGSEPAAPKDGDGTARDLKRRLAAFRDQLKGLCAGRAPGLAASLDLLFALQDGRDASGTTNNWESLNFYDVPLAAGIATLSKLQADVRSAENDLVKWLYGSVTDRTYTMSSLTSAVVPQSAVVMLGDTFRADVFLSAFDEKNRATIERTVDGRSLPVPMGPDAKGKLRVAADRVGEQVAEGVIHFQGPNGPEDHPYRVAYQVMAPLLVASPTKMNVLYRGVDNPLDLSVPGVPAENIRPLLDNGAIARAGNSWVAKVNTVGKAKLSVVATLPDGGTRTIGPVEFRVKDLPAPMAYMGGKSARDSRIKRTELRAAQGVIARLENSDFDAPFKVTSFTLTVLHNGTAMPHAVRGNAFSEEARAAIEAAREGDRVYVEDIKARLVNGAGVEYTLSPIALKVVQ